jgi:UDP-GlcNAc:undecaprenyl-phosphate GlcNAc-1-phosphate transferase
LPTPLWAAILPLGIAFVTTFALVPQVRRFAIECRVADKPNGRKLHAHAIPHLGGVAIFSGYFFGLLVALASPAGSLLADRVLALLPALLILFGLGLVDDLRGLRAGTKLTYQILGATFAVGMGAGFGIPAAGDPWTFAALAAVSILWYVGVCNSINLIDGLDGLAAGVVGLAAAGFLVVGVRVGDHAVTTAALCTIGAVAAFLRFNFHPARIFMGDTGAMFLGFGLAALGCLLARDVGFWVALLGSATLLGVPIMDTTAAIVRRVLARRHIFEADGEHTHHRLLRAGLSHRGAVLVLYALQAVFTALGVATLSGFAPGFPIAVAVGVAAAVTISSHARRAAPQVVRAPVATVRALPQVREAAPARLRAAGRGPARREDVADDVLHELPPAAVRPS